MWADEKVLELESDDGCKTLGMYSMPLTHTLLQWLK